MKNKQLGFMILCSCVLVFAGCGGKETVQNGEAAEMAAESEETGFGITQEEQKLVAEYAAGVLMKYNAGSGMRILEGQKLEQAEIQEQAEKAQEEKREQLAEEYQAKKEAKASEKKESKNNGEQNGNSAAGTVSYISDVAAAAGMDDFSIRYSGYEITESYAEDEESFYAVEAVSGKVLLVLNFDVANVSGQAGTLHMYPDVTKYRLNLNGEQYKAQQTFLLNDLSMYEEEIAPGATVQTVLIFEIPQEKAADVGEMELKCTIGDEVSVMQLQGGSAAVNAENDVEASTDSELAEEYEAALGMEGAEENQEAAEDTEENAGGNVTTVGSHNSVIKE